MSLVTKKAPDFTVDAVVGDGDFKKVSLSDYKGKYVVLFFYPADFTFICPTEIQEFSRRHEEFRAANCEILGASTDTHFVHLAWRNNHPDLKTLPYPMLADTKRELSQALGVLHKTDGVALRATFIVDPEGIIRHVSVNDLSVGRNVDEVLRVLDALQTDELCPCNWKKGEATLEVA